MRLLLKTTIVALVVAALGGVVALVSGEMNDIGWRVLGTSVSFGLACTIGAAGADLARRQRPHARRLGVGTMALAAGAFALFALAIWADIGGHRGDLLAGSVAILALEAGHAAFVLARTRPDDRDGVRLLVGVSLIATTLSATLGVWMTWSDTAGDGSVRLLGALLIVQLAAAIVPSLLRRVQAAERPPALADEFVAIADRLERATTAGAARHEARRLRELAEASRG